jgi:hypothetical protein
MEMEDEDGRRRKEKNWERREFICPSVSASDL